MSEIEKGPTACRRCGTCCEAGGPALHREDLALLRGDGLARSDLVTVRAGEPASDPRLGGKVAPTAREFLKLAGSGGGWCCRFYDRQSRGCGIYAQRPIECRLLFCGDTAPLREVIGHGLLSRRDLLPDDDPVLPLLARQEREISVAATMALLSEAPVEDLSLLARLNGLVLCDLELRQLFLRSFPEREREELFLFGRPLFLILAPYGFRLRETKTGPVLDFTPGGLPIRG